VRVVSSRSRMLSRNSLVMAAPLVGSYVLVVRPRLLRWGATDDELRRPFPGADIIDHGTRSATNAVTIDAPPSAVWPWLVQMGVDRAGWYSWDRLDNFGRHSSQGSILSGRRSPSGTTSTPRQTEASGGRSQSASTSACSYSASRAICGASASILAGGGRACTPTRRGAGHWRSCLAAAPGWSRAATGILSRDGFKASWASCSSSRNTG
jgi:hypothetical protein